MRASALAELYSTATHISAALHRSDVTAGSFRLLGAVPVGTARVSAFSCSGSRRGGDSAVGVVVTLRSPARGGTQPGQEQQRRQQATHHGECQQIHRRLAQQEVKPQQPDDVFGPATGAQEHGRCHVQQEGHSKGEEGQ